ncbi:MAG: acyl-CoA-binding protein [Candidatus Sericytochromatia bacterium]
MDLAKQFEDAKGRSTSLPSQSNDTKLQIYSLYKQATEGDVTGSRPGMFDMVGGAKYDAWSTRKGMSKEDAMQAYVDLINKLGS